MQRLLGGTEPLPRERDTGTALPRASTLPWPQVSSPHSDDKKALCALAEALKWERNSHQREALEREYARLLGGYRALPEELPPSQLVDLVQRELAHPQRQGNPETAPGHSVRIKDAVSETRQAHQAIRELLTDPSMD